MKTILIYSGGLDSTVLLYHLHQAGNHVAALTIDYGQRHAKELDSARWHAARLGITHKVLPLGQLAEILGSSHLIAGVGEIPEGHYAEESMKATVVPNRNMILLSLATGWAISLEADSVSYAAHSGDHAIYPDCRKEFADAMDAAIRLCDWREVRLERPFVNWTKADIARRARELGVPVEHTWSCYKGGELHCGRCGTCVERREAFHLAGVDDPTSYAADAPSLSDLVANEWRLER